ncbi:MAG: hypothetical protein J7J94_03685 [Thaumarchaeota archaeon]|nr:hypothetical protein [Nitrososphaerota archaeon]
MSKAVAGYGVGVGLLTLLGILMSAGGPQASSQTQFNIFLLLLNAYTPLLTPLSSMMGAQSIGGLGSYGIIPLAAWLLVGVLVGVLVRSAGGGAKATFLTASTVLLLWIGSLFLSAPAWPDNSHWVFMVNRMATELVSRPIDMIFLFAAPIASSALTGEIAYLVRSKVVRHEEIEERYTWF